MLLKCGVLRRIGKISWKRFQTNDQVWDNLKTKPSLLNKIKSRKLEYLAMSRDIKLTPSKKKYQKGSYKEEEQEADQEQCGQTTSTRAAQDRDVWRAIARQVC